ncbi:MAG: biopolymer transporter ExbD [Rikenellaceae bacterium]|jgi:biopolymer transport protein ExbD|nr:biopolymer transporter ExbD [Rikenellaceae bacterium]
MKIERKRSRAAEVYTASLNDILFFLMLFFLIISTMVTPMAIRVMLPKSSTSKQVATKKNINLAITSDRRYFLDDSQVSFDDIEPAIAAQAAGLDDEQKPNILLQADNTLDLQSVVRVIDIGNRLNMRVILFTEKE